MKRHATAESVGSLPATERFSQTFLAAVTMSALLLTFSEGNVEGPLIDSLGNLSRIVHGSEIFRSRDGLDDGDRLLERGRPVRAQACARPHDSFAYNNK